jgi:predicted ester cyclase
MSLEANKATSRRWVEEVFSKGNLAVADEIVAPNHSNSGPAALPGMPNGPEGGKMLVTVYRTAFPDIHFTVEEQIAEGDMVVTRWTATGTQKGELAGIPPTGKSGTVTGINRDRFANGMIAETWAIFDQFGLMQQLGVIPSPGQTGS